MRSWWCHPLASFKVTPLDVSFPIFKERHDVSAALTAFFAPPLAFPRP